MKTNLILIMGSCLLLITGCAMSRAYTWQDVTRVVEPQIPTYTPQGSLLVYTERASSGGGTSEDEYYPYLPYTLYGADGKLLRSVENHENIRGDEPEHIKLPPGKYVVVPDVSLTKREIVGVIVEDGKTTEVRLQES